MYIGKYLNTVISFWSNARGSAPGFQRANSKTHTHTHTPNQMHIQINDLYRGREENNGYRINEATLMKNLTAQKQQLIETANHIIPIRSDGRQR